MRSRRFSGRTVNASLIRSVVLFTATNALAAGMPLLLLPVLTRVLTPADYGLVAMYSVVITAFGALCGFSVHGAVGMRYFDRETMDFPRFVGNCVFILLGTSLLLFLLVLIAGGALQQYVQVPRSWLLIAVGVCALQFLLQIRLSIFQSAKAAAEFALFRSGQALIDAGSSVLLVVSFAMAWQGRLIGMSAGIGVMGLLALLSMLRGGWISLVPNRSDMAQALRFGFPLIPHVIGGMVLATVDRMLITNLAGASATGIYMVALQVGMGVYLIADACSRAISPWFIETLKRNDGAADYDVARYSLLYFAALLLFAAVVGLVALYVLPFIVGEGFSTSARYVFLAATAQAVAGMYLIVSNTVFYHGRTLNLSFVTISSGVLNAVLSYFLIQKTGVMGAFIANLVAQIYLFSAIFYLSQRLHPLPWGKVLSNRLRKEQAGGTRS